MEALSMVDVSSMLVGAEDDLISDGELLFAHCAADRWMIIKPFYLVINTICVTINSLNLHLLLFKVSLLPAKCPRSNSMHGLNEN